MWLKFPGPLFSVEAKISGPEHVKAQKDFDPQTSAFFSSALRQKEMKGTDTGDGLLRVKSPGMRVYQSGVRGGSKGPFTQHTHGLGGTAESENLQREFSCSQTLAAWNAELELRMLPGGTDQRDTVEKQTLVEDCMGQIHGWEQPPAEAERR